MADEARCEEQPAPELFEVACASRLLVARFSRPQAMLSWAMARPGFQAAREVVWVEASGAELPLGVDAFALLERRLAEAGLPDAVAMMTARDVRRHHVADAPSGAVQARCLATVGLSNAARVGILSRANGPGTINLLAAVSCALTEAALIEALSIATEARTGAVMELGWRTDGAVATGTGTDCVVVAAPLIPPLAKGRVAPRHAGSGGDRPGLSSTPSKSDVSDLDHFGGPTPQQRSWQEAPTRPSLREGHPPQASLEEGSPAPFAGLHTDIGAALGAAVHAAVAAGGQEWIAERSG